MFTNKGYTVSQDNKYISMKQIVFSAIEVSKDSKVPVLFLSNPGAGKSTLVKLWADRNGYKVTSLIGSQHSSEEVLGYMINDGGKLRTATPDWYDEIIERDSGIADETTGQKVRYPTVLFIDEISTAPEIVQGAMLQLIFDRKCAGRHYLPDSTLIVSAANYQGNLPSNMTLLSPIVNRFMVVNLRFGSTDRLLDQFLVNDLGVVKDQGLTDNDVLFEKDSEMVNKLVGSKDDFLKMRRLVREMLKNKLGTLVDVYRNVDGNRLEKKNHIGACDNQELMGVYDSTSVNGGDVCNFISGRTVSYLAKVMDELVQYKTSSTVTRSSYVAFVKLLTDGLIGSAFCKITEAKVASRYKKDAAGIVVEIVSQVKDIVANGHKLATEAPKEGITGQAGSLDELLDKVDMAITEFERSDGGQKLIDVMNDIDRVFPYKSSPNNNYYGIGTQLMNDLDKFKALVIKLHRVLAVLMPGEEIRMTINQFLNRYRTLHINSGDNIEGLLNGITDSIAVTELKDGTRAVIRVREGNKLYLYDSLRNIPVRIAHSKIDVVFIVTRNGGAWVALDRAKAPYFR
jgi:hypothetical protein